MASNASRYLFLFLIGLAVGILGTVMAMRAIDARQDHFPGSVMDVQAWHMGQLKAATQQNRCAATDTLPHLQALRTMANDIEPAFGDLRDDARFSKHASDLRATLDSALASPHSTAPASAPRSPASARTANLPPGIPQLTSSFAGE